MIATVILTLQVAAATDPSVAVRVGDRMVSLAVVRSAEALAVRADAVAAATGGALSGGAGDAYALEIGGARIQLEPGLAIARIDSAIVPLTGAPWLDGAALFIPLQVVTELVPRFATGFFYEPARRELRAFDRGTPRSTDARTPTPPRTEPRTPARPRVTRGRTVVIDAGHGGPDNGMSGPVGGDAPRIYEKNVTLSVARLLERQLRDAGLTVVMTRTRDTLIALSDRGRIANRARGDLFISVHVNAAPTTWRNPGAGRGFETYFLAEAKTEDARRVEQMENESVRFETGANAPRGDPLSFIITDMAQNEHLRESNDLAATIQESLSEVHPGPDRGVKQANFAVLRGSFMPAVLVEIGFGTNPEEAAFMASAQGQRQIATAIASGALEYLAHYEQRVGGTR